MARKEPRTKIEARKKGWAVVRRGRVIFRTRYDLNDCFCFLDGYFGKPAGWHKEQRAAVDAAWDRFGKTGTFTQAAV